jgi:hypothetical protein
LAGGIGVVGVGLGAIFGAMSFSQWSNATRECGSVATCGSGSQAQNDKSSASTSATLSDVGFVAGVVLIGGAAALWFTAPSGTQVQVTPAVNTQGAGLSMRGAF